MRGRIERTIASISPRRDPKSTFALAVSLILAGAGCADHRPHDQRGPAGPSIVPDSSAPTPTASLPDQNIGPRFIIPATGGLPVLALPLGGDIYQPVTGGAPIIGIPTGP